jgi:hypothetical protein
MEQFDLKLTDFLSTLLNYAKSSLSLYVTLTPSYDGLISSDYYEIKYVKLNFKKWRTVKDVPYEQTQVLQ